MAFQSDSIYWVEVEKVVANPFQPRREFDEAKLTELADSIRMYGVLQPLTVTRKEIQREDGTFYTEYELIAGERRLRASKLAGVAQVPVIIREGEQSEQEKLELAIIENLQREDLNAVDRALAFRQLADSFGLSHAQVAEKVGRSREYVSNTIRLLALPEYILNGLRQGDISEGHARTLLMLSDKPEEQHVIYQEITLKKLSVRESERIIRKIAADKVRKKTPDEFDTELLEYEKQFTETLGTRVQIQKTDFGGKLTIDYFSVADLEAILERMRDADAPAAAQASVHEAINALREHTPLESVTETNTTEAVAEGTAPEVAPDNEHAASTAAARSHGSDSYTAEPTSNNSATSSPAEAAQPEASATPARSTAVDATPPTPPSSGPAPISTDTQAASNDATKTSAVPEQSAAPQSAANAPATSEQTATDSAPSSATPVTTAAPTPTTAAAAESSVAPSAATPEPMHHPNAGTTEASPEATRTTPPPPQGTPATTEASHSSATKPNTEEATASQATAGLEDDTNTNASTVNERRSDDDAGLYSIRNFSI